MATSTDGGGESDMGAVGLEAAQDRAVIDAHLLGFAAAANDTNLANRYIAARNAGLAFGGDRDYYETLGYTRDPSVEDYYAKYLRNDIARTIVDAPANATWRERPQVIDGEDEGRDEDAETEFEQAVEYLFDEHRLLHYLERTDRVSGIGEYGILFLGLAEEPDENGNAPSLEDPAQPGEFDSILETKEDPNRDFDDLAYLSTFSQARVKDIDMVTEPTNPRYGLPEKYQIEFDSHGTQRTDWVHYTRVIHVAEDLLENEVFGRPRLEAVLNRLEDLEKVVGGSAEMFWRGADRKLHLNYQGDGRPQDSGEVANEAEEMAHGLRDVLTTSNTELQSIEGEDVDPSGVVDKLLELIAGETGIPKRILTGSERGELASTQDRATFYGRIQQRQEQFAEPMLLRPVLDRLIDLGILPDPDDEDGVYTIEWPDLFELNELEQAELRKKNAEALKAASPGGDPGQTATTAEVRENIMAWSPELGEESSLDTDPEVEEREDEGDPTDYDEADEDALEDILDDGGGEDGDGAARPDEGEDDPSVEDLLED